MDTFNVMYRTKTTDIFTDYYLNVQYKHRLEYLYDPVHVYDFLQYSFISSIAAEEPDSECTAK